MKKRILMAAVLIGTMLTTSCLDDKESSSVKAVRDAKANQLNALAELSKAEAKVQEVLAAYYEQIAKQEADSFAIAIKVAEAKAEADIAEQRAKAQQAMYNYVLQAEAQATQLYALYDVANSDLYTLRGNVIRAKSLIAGLEAGVISAEEAHALTVYTLERTNRRLEAENAAYAEYVTYDLDKLYAEYSKLLAESNQLSEEVAQATAVVSTATNNLNEAEKALDAANYADNSSVYVANPLASVAAIAGLLEMEGSTWAGVEETAIEGSSAVVYSLNQEEVLSARRIYELALEGANDALGRPATTTTPAEGIYLSLNYAQLLTDLQTARTNLATTNNAANRDAVRLAEIAVANADILIDEKKQDVVDATADLAEYNGYLTAFSNGNTAYQAAIANVENLVAALDAANDAKNAIQDELDIVNAAKGVAATLYGSVESVDVEELIRTNNKTIADNNKTIKDGASIGTAEAALADKKAEIEKLEAEIEYKEAQLNYIIAQLEAHLAAL